MIRDSVLARTLMALLQSFPASNVFWIAKLAGCDERVAAKALGELERSGLATNDSGRWSLTRRGAGTRQPDLRPMHVTMRGHPSRMRPR
jgi:hypothetical protein